MSTGPLHGVRVLDLGGIGPGPFASMMLADMGADVVRVDRPGEQTLFPGPPERNTMNRNKRSIALNLRQPEDHARARSLADVAHMLIEGFRPGTTERLGLGPDELHTTNPALVYGRMTGWGQDGPRALTAGHDINYIAVTGALHTIGPAGGPPQIPLNLLGDFGGGATYLVAGLLAALYEAQTTGRGQVVDMAIIDGVSHLLAGVHARMAVGDWVDERGRNFSDGSMPFYTVYETKDGLYMAVGALENKFYAELLTKLGIDEPAASQYDRAAWPRLREQLTERFRSATQADWTEVFDGSDACVSPVLGLRDAVHEPQVAARGSIVDSGAIEPGRAPRFSAHPTSSSTTPPRPGEHGEDIVRDWLGAR